MNRIKIRKTQASVCSGPDQSAVCNDLIEFIWKERTNKGIKKNQGKPGFILVIEGILSFYDRRITPADQIKSSKQNGIVEQVTKQAVVEKRNPCHICLHQP